MSTTEETKQVQQEEPSILVDFDDNNNNNNSDDTNTIHSTQTDIHDDFKEFSVDANSLTPINSDTTPSKNNNDEFTDFADFGTAQTISSDISIAADNNDNSNSNNSIDDFGDFGDFAATTTTTTITTNTNNAADDDDDDGFGDFGAAPSNNFGNGNEADDDDGFGDFGTAQTAGEGNDDDFGDFNDFAGGDEFGDSGDFGEFGTSGNDDAFETQEPAPVETQPTTVIEPVVETAPDFTAVNSRQVESYVLERLASLYPISDEDTLSSQLLNPELEQIDTASVLSDQELWVSLCEGSFQGGNVNSTANSVSKSTTSSAPQFQWKYSNLRKEYYASLGMVVAKEQVTSTAISSSTGPASKPRSSTPMVVGGDNTSERKPFNIEETRSYCQFTRESLGGYSGDEMKDIIAQLTALTSQASDELTYWLDQREQMIMDCEKYNEMIKSLVGRAAQLKTAESKQNAKSKRLTRTSFNLK